MLPINHSYFFLIFFLIFWLFFGILLYLELIPELWKCCPPPSSAKMSTIFQFCLIFLPFSGYFLVDYHIWQCTLDPQNVITNSENQPPIFPDFSDVLLLFHLKRHERTHNSILGSCSFLCVYLCTYFILHNILEH